MNFAQPFSKIISEHGALTLNAIVTRLTKTSVCLSFSFFIAIYSTAVRAEPLRFISHELVPFTWIDEQKQAKGIAYDLAKATMEKMGYGTGAVEIYPFIRALKTVQEQENVVIFQVAWSPEREATMKWVGPLLSDGVYFYTWRGNTAKIHTLNDLRMLRDIGVGAGNASLQVLKGKGFQNLHVVDNEMQAIKMLALHRVDAVPIGEMVVQDMQKRGLVPKGMLENTGIKLLETKLYMGFSRNIADTQIQNWQRALDQVKREKFNSLRRLYLED